MRFGDGVVRFWPWARGRPALILSSVFGVVALISLNEAINSAGIGSLLLRLAISVSFAVQCGIYFLGWRRSRSSGPADQRDVGSPQ